MSPIRYRGRHRKPRPSRTGGLLRGGVLTGVVGSVAVTGSTSPALAAEKPTESTGELPALDLALAQGVDRATQATAAYATQAESQADWQNWQRAQSRAASQAGQAAAERRAEADRRAQEAREAEEARLAQEAQEAEEARERAAAAEAQTLSAPADEAPVTGTGADAVLSYVRAQLGDAYAMGASGPDAWDCSSLTQAAFATVGVSLPRVAADQSVAGTPVSLDALQPGDLLHWGGAGSAYHVAVYMGDGTFIGAQNPSTGVVQKTLDWDPPTGAVRVL
ncbi:NlpC/P60 family protein [Streptomyces radicis]|uniref:NlpC/P60 family protein n=1 Tax=Streptomyces radicis TaxID=1750517 RepID=A0A3A9W879_9ACTN|nr:NlpC/P60 family protein [Streptomyces radicis]RKN17413.1 NlpC/P60 family protein [Streptomyces radicis]